MDGISFGGIYDAFDSFERQMEEGLANILDEDDPPSVAVAASATQSFQSIIGCDLTRIFMDDTKKKPKKTGLSFDNKNAIAAPRLYQLERLRNTGFRISGPFWRKMPRRET